MNREEKLKLSAETEYVHAFKQGLFAKLYEQSLWRFVHAVRPLKPMREKVKGGQDVVYGGLPVKSFEALMEAGGFLAGAEVTEYGWRWRAAAPPEEAPAFEDWRAGLSPAQTAVENPEGIGGRDILAEILSYDLAGSTPLQAMLAIGGWREYLQNNVDRAG